MSRATRGDVALALRHAGAESVALEEPRAGVLVIHLGWRPRWPIEDARDVVRDVLRDALPAGVSWIAQINGHWVIRPAALTLYPLVWDKYRLGQRVVHPRAASKLAVALWWRRRDLHQVTRVGRSWVECERLRWSWASWSWRLDPCPDDGLDDLLDVGHAATSSTT